MALKCRPDARPRCGCPCRFIAGTGGLADFARSFPHQLRAECNSGSTWPGRSRSSRSCSTRRAVASVDAQTREALQVELLAICQRAQVTACSSPTTLARRYFSPTGLHLQPPSRPRRSRGARAAAEASRRCTPHAGIFGLWGIRGRARIGGQGASRPKGRANAMTTIILDATGAPKRQGRACSCRRSAGGAIHPRYQVLLVLFVGWQVTRPRFASNRRSYCRRRPK